MFNQQGQEPDVFTVHAVKPSEFQHSVDFVSCDWLRQQYFAFFWHAARRQAWVQLCEALQSTLKGVWFVRWRYCEWIAEASQCNATITLVHAGGHIMRYLIGFIEYSKLDKLSSDLYPYNIHCGLRLLVCCGTWITWTLVQWMVYKDHWSPAGQKLGSKGWSDFWRNEAHEYCFLSWQC